MKNSFLLTLVILLAIGCDSNDTPSPDSPISESQQIADSLQQVADSIAERRELHTAYQGGHIHAPGSDLAEAAHQDPNKIDRVRATQVDQAESRSAAAAARGQRIQEISDSAKPNTNTVSDSTIVFEEAFPDF